MAAALKFSPRRLEISKASATIVIVIAVASFVTVFSLVACKSLLSQKSYQSRVIAGKEKAKKQLKANLTAADSLQASYKTFIAPPENIIGGNPSGTGDRDGDNARIILDALPSKYDFPALTSSLEKILKSRNYKIVSIAGTDDEINQQQNDTNDKPTPVEIPFQLSVSGSYSSVTDLLLLFEHSIRPFNVQSIGLTGTNSSMTVTLSIKTYYQPENKLTIKSEVVK